MKYIGIICTWLLAWGSLKGQEDPGIWAQNNTTPTYFEMVDWYRKLDQQFEAIQMRVAGKSDSGLELYVVEYTPPNWEVKEGLTVLINSAIHPGEPCGVNACMEWLWDELHKPVGQLKTTKVVIIPAYNIGGMLNRSGTSRANQIGPEEYGFRGNARHLDLNRDFIKMDSENTGVFVQLFHQYNPDIFIDTHTSNGADYPYTGTLITTVLEKQSPPLGSFTRNTIEPYLYQQNYGDEWPLVPYVFGFPYGSTPLEGGISDFMDSPRYSTGYTSLFQTIGFVTEAHMYKPFSKRVQFTERFIHHVLQWTDRMENLGVFRQKREEAWLRLKAAKSLPISWQIREETADSLEFFQYAKKEVVSQVTGLPHWVYDSTEIQSGRIPYRRNTVQLVRAVPQAYYISQAWKQVIHRLQKNGIMMEVLDSIQELKVRGYTLNNLQYGKQPYEGHFVHAAFDLDTVELTRTFYPGDLKIALDQRGKRFLLETLEPDAPDSYFRWNFFDSALQQKEYFSAFSFEPKMEQYLKENSHFKEQFEVWKQTEIGKKANHQDQLNWLYRNSPFMEENAFLYPVFHQQ